MKKVVMSLVMAAGLLAFTVSGWAATITGQLVKIDGSNYIVKDAAGKEHRIHFDDSTKKTGEIKAGAQVEVAEDKGHATTIKVAEAMKK